MYDGLTEIAGLDNEGLNIDGLNNDGRIWATTTTTTTTAV